MKNAKNSKVAKSEVSAPVAAFPVNPMAQFKTLGELQKQALTKAPAKAKGKTAKEQAQAIVKDVIAPVAKSAPVITVKPDTKPAIVPEIKSLCLVNYAISEYARPKGGALLFAFTAAWLEMFGLYNGKAASKGAISAVAGTTVIGYHIKQGNFDIDAKGHLQLSALGLNKFNERKLPTSKQHYSDKVKDAFIGIMTTGDIDGALVKSKSALIKLCA